MSYIMILEDQALVAELMRRKVTELCDRPVEVFRSEAKALARLEVDTPEVAFIDVNLGDHDSFRISLSLLRQGVKLFLITSYSNTSLRALGAPPELSDVDFILKENFYDMLPAILKVD
jgi:two-component SAPR family response regulator